MYCIVQASIPTSFCWIGPAWLNIANKSRHRVPRWNREYVTKSNDNSFRVVTRRIIVIYSQGTLNGYINVLHILNRKVLQKEISYSRSVAPIRLYYKSIDTRGEEENGSEKEANISPNNCFKKRFSQYSNCAWDSVMWMVTFNASDTACTARWSHQELFRE